MYQLYHELDSVAIDSVTLVTDGKEAEKDTSRFNDSSGSQEGHFDSETTCSLLQSGENERKYQQVIYIPGKEARVNKNTKTARLTTHAKEMKTCCYQYVFYTSSVHHY